MADVNIEYNPKDWGGYIKEYNTETAYNNAIKPLPHSARITETQEVKFAGGYEPINSKKWIKWDVFNNSGSFLDFDEESTYEDLVEYWNVVCDSRAKYYLCGIISQNNKKYYLWKWNGNYSGSQDSYEMGDYKNYFVLTETDNLSDMRPFKTSAWIQLYGISGLLTTDNEIPYTAVSKNIIPGIHKINSSNNALSQWPTVYDTGEDQ